LGFLGGAQGISSGAAFLVLFNQPNISFSRPVTVPNIKYSAKTRELVAGPSQLAE